MSKTKSRSGKPAPALIHESYTCSLANGTVEWGFCFKKPESDDIEFDLVIDAATPDVATAERINADFARMEWAAKAVCAAAADNVYALSRNA